MGSSNTPEPVQKLTLKMSGQGTTEDQVAIDSEALRRQQELVKAGSVSRGASTPSGRNLRSLASPVPSSGRESHDVVPDGTPNVPSGDAKAAPSTFANNAEGQPVSTQAAAHTTSNEHPRPVSQQGQSSIDSIWRKPGQGMFHSSPQTIGGPETDLHRRCQPCPHQESQHPNASKLEGSETVPSRYSCLTTRSTTVCSCQPAPVTRLYFTPS